MSLVLKVNYRLLYEYKYVINLGEAVSDLHIRTLCMFVETKFLWARHFSKQLYILACRTRVGEEKIKNENRKFEKEKRKSADDNQTASTQNS